MVMTLLGRAQERIDVAGNVNIVGNLSVGGQMVVVGDITSANFGGTQYWSCPGQNFKGRNPDTNDIVYAFDEPRVDASADNISFVAPVFLPHGAVVTAVVVFGNAAASAETWTLYRGPLTAGPPSNMATANINTEDNSINFATIENNNYAYWIVTSSLDTGDQIFSARITYTI